jgi:L-ascorbate metabolism protein UlaG (beta-lactamase superfamily)
MTLTKAFYLKPNVQIEPLVNQWHAYPYLIAPATAAMVTANYQISTMKSYLQMPMAHEAALKNPDMVGGPFIDYQGKRLGEIRALKERIESGSKPLLELAKAIKQLYVLLQDKAKGYPLESLYAEIPPALAGYVELVYDLEHQPSFRFIEELLYNGTLYNKGTQSIALALVENDARPFIFSTPRLKNPGAVHLPIHLDDARIDALAGLKTVPQPYAAIKELLNIPDEDDEVFNTFLTEQKPRVTERYQGEGVRVRYFGHACVLLETSQTSILLDPLISYKYDSEIERFTYEDLPEKIDYVLITHAHHDHIVLETLLQLRTRIGTIVVPRGGNGYLEDPSVKLILQRIGFRNVVELDELASLEVEGGSITGIPFYGEHCDLNIRSKSAYLVRLAGTSFLMAADSSSINPAVYQNVQKAVGNIDVLFVGLECTGAPMSWCYGSLFPRPLDRQIDQARRSKGSDAATGWLLMDIFSVRHVYLYAMGSEPWLNYFMALQHGHSSASTDESAKLLAASAERGITAEKLFASRELVFDSADVQAVPAGYAY